VPRSTATSLDSPVFKQTSRVSLHYPELCCSTITDSRLYQVELQSAMMAKQRKLDEFFTGKSKITLTSGIRSESDIIEHEDIGTGVCEGDAGQLYKNDGNVDVADSQTNCLTVTPTYVSGVSNDLGFVPRQDLPRKEVYRLLVGEGTKSIPILPKLRNGRPFLSQWLQDPRFCNWSVYTQKDGGEALCKVCFFMGAKLRHGVLKNAAFVDRPCIHFRKFIEKALSHSKSMHHKEAVVGAVNFKQSIECGESVADKMSQAGARLARENREIIASVVKTVMLCATNNIPLRGHKLTTGNFTDLLNFRIDAGDHVLAEHFTRIQNNAKYTSPQIQNEVLAAASATIVNIILEANRSYFSVIADKSADILSKEQLSLVLRYLDGNVIRENFIGFVELPSLNAEKIADTILSRLKFLGLDLERMVGQGYNGASTMAGHVSGVQRRIRTLYPAAMFVHCAAHCFNLTINDQSQVSVIRNTCDIMRQAIVFFRESPKRRSELGINLPMFSQTRWSAKYQSIRVFKLHFEKFLHALDE